MIVFITFMVNHGNIDFSGIDWVKDRTEEAIQSEEGQQYVEETKEISKNVFQELFYGIVGIFTGDDDSSEESTLEQATLLSCIDGDTIKVSINGEEKTVRLIGIDAPESVNPDEELNTEYGTMASNYLSALLENVSTVYLEYDVSTEDTYGRTLAYVWLTSTPKEPENNMLNAILVKNGYADDVVYMPNTKYADIFISLKETASENSTGLWIYDDIKDMWS